MQFSINPSNLMRALSQALEHSTNGLSRHHWRTAMIADKIGDYIQMENWSRQRMVYAALLHDLGAASNWTERFVNAASIYSHAEAGYELLNESKQLKMLAQAVRHHHDNWSGDNPSGLAGKDIPLPSRVIHLADRVELLLRDDSYIVDQREGILSALLPYAGRHFDPDLIKALQDISRQESFWLDLANPHYYENFFRAINTYWRMQLNVDDVIDIAEIFATIIDRTSKFTGMHSRRVSQTAEYLARIKGYSPDEVKMMRIAGLFHDLGKLALPNNLLEKPGKLTPQEFSLIKQHTYYTYRILEQIDGFQTIAEWAAYHHETLDGTGYPFRIPGNELRLGSRMLAVADVFTALTEDRPYRQQLTYPEVHKIMNTMVANKKIDRMLVGELFENYNDLMDHFERLPNIS